MKKIIGVFVGLGLFLVGCNRNAEEGVGGNEETTIKVGIVSIIDHPALDSLRDNFKEQLKTKKIDEVDGISFRYKSAQGRIADANQIIAGYIGKVDMILAIGTPVAKVAAEKIKDKPVVFAAITDPVGAGLVDSMEKPGRNLTGTSDMNPIQDQLLLIKALLPKAKRVGIVYNNGEPNSVVMVKLAQEKAKSLGIEIVEATAMRTADVKTAVSSLIGKVDAVFMTTDNTVAAAVDVITATCKENAIPFFSAEDKTVRDGEAVAAMCVNYGQLGRQTANIAARILKGENPAEIPVEFQKDFDLVINKGMAKSFGISIPEEILQKAEVVQ